MAGSIGSSVNHVEPRVNRPRNGSSRGCRGRVQPRALGTSTDSAPNWSWAANASSRLLDASSPLEAHFGTNALRESAHSAAAALKAGVNDNALALRLPSLPLPNTWLDPAAQAAAAFSSAATTASTVVGSLASNASQLQESAASSAPGLLDGAPALPPHFGTLAVTSALRQLLAWCSRQLEAMHVLDSEALSPLTQALSQLEADARSSQAAIALEKVKGQLGQLPSISSFMPQAPSLPAFSPADVDLPALLAAVAAASEHVQAEGIGGYSLQTVVLITAGVAALVAASTPSPSYDPMADLGPGPELPLRYDAAQVAGYYVRRPVLVSQRAAEVAVEALRLGVGLLLDSWQGKMRQNAPLRARQLREAIERLGPAYVKVAQALSTRVDILTPEYLAQIELLQDRVPPFSSDLATQVMSKAFGKPVGEVFSTISPSPVAAASLGQVYKGCLRPAFGGGNVAVKVRRPQLLEAIALDLYLMRGMATLIASANRVNTDWAALIDEWSSRFFDELDYEREAANATLFQAQMAELDGIVVPSVYASLSNHEVLTTTWIEGEKFSESNAGDVRELCDTLLNAYLIQLLDTGFLHADPHPGNLIRTPNGKLCILDFGLMTQVTPAQSIALVEYITHLSIEDWDAITDDLLALGFIPDGAPNPRDSGLSAPLGNILSQLVKGGGAKGVNIELITRELEVLTRQYPFQIPPYFALILRAFSVIEGIALRVDPSYSIVKECFPYITRRLLTDDHPRAQAALRALLYGNKSRLDLHRLQRVVQGFSSFTVEGLASQQPVSPLGPVAKEALTVLFSKRGSYAQQLLVEELVAAVDAVSREVASTLVKSVLGSTPAIAAMSTMEALGPLRFVLFPLPTPLEVLTRLAPVVAMKDQDEEALSTVRGLVQMVRDQPATAQLDVASLQSAAAVAGDLASILPELVPGLAFTGEQFVRQYLRRVALRVADDLKPAATFTTEEATSYMTKQPIRSSFDEQPAWISDV